MRPIANVDAAGERAQRQHPRAGKSGVAAGEQRKRCADAEQRDRRDADRRREARRRRVRSGTATAATPRPAANEHERARRGAERRAQLVEVEAKLLARERVERVLRDRRPCACASASGLAFRQALGGVDQRELLRFGLRILLQLVALERDLVLVTARAATARTRIRRRPSRTRRQPCRRRR